MVVKFEITKSFILFFTTMFKLLLILFIIKMYVRYFLEI